MRTYDVTMAETADGPDPQDLPNRVDYEVMTFDPRSPPASAQKVRVAVRVVF